LLSEEIRENYGFKKTGKYCKSFHFFLSLCVFT
jgi:hypothetical protein